jgi:hypothetical protein
MHLMVSRSYPVIDGQTLTEYVARDALFRTADGSYFLYMASAGQLEREERILFMDCRDALLWLNEAADVPLISWADLWTAKNERLSLYGNASGALP